MGERRLLEGFSISRYNARNISSSGSFTRSEVIPISQIREYRIGEFAKYLGVTPDLLKHYEDQGIIQPTRSDSGYRYYPFNTTMLFAIIQAKCLGRYHDSGQRNHIFIRHFHHL